MLATGAVVYFDETGVAFVHPDKTRTITRDN
jgi:hypothetical protein